MESCPFILFKRVCKDTEHGTPWVSKGTCPEDMLAFVLLSACLFTYIYSIVLLCYILNYRKTSLKSLSWSDRNSWIHKAKQSPFITILHFYIALWALYNITHIISATLTTTPKSRPQDYFDIWVTAALMWRLLRLLWRLLLNSWRWRN